MFSTSSCKAMIGELAQKLGLSLDKDQVRDYIIQAGQTKKQEIKAELKDKFVYLKFDCATRSYTNYIGVNVRFVKDNQAVTRTLAVVDTRSRHTAFELRLILNSVLTDYEISKKNILVAVTDNASNMVKLMADMNKEIEEAQAAVAEDGDLSDSDSDEQDSDHEDDEDLPPVISSIGIAHQRCGAHTLQLCIKDGINESRAFNLIASARQVVVAGRTPTVMEFIRQETGKILLLDVPTRWGSTYIMLRRLLELKEVVQRCANMGNNNMKLVEAQWKMIKAWRYIFWKNFMNTYVIFLPN